MSLDLSKLEHETFVVNSRTHTYEVYIGRPSKWGNPFVIGADGTREEVIEKYKAYILGNKELLDALPELKGKNLGCWCKPLACHGDILVELCDGELISQRTDEQSVNG